MFDTLAMLSHDVGTTAACWSGMVALWALFAAGLVECAKENDGAATA